MLKLFAAFLALAAVPGQAAFACSCIPCEEIGVVDKEEGIIFVGELISIRKLQSDWDNTDHVTLYRYSPASVHVFKVLRSLKGHLPEYVHIQVDTYSTCSAHFPFEGLNAVSAIELGEDSFGSKAYYADMCTQYCLYSEGVRPLITERTYQTDIPEN